MIEEIHQKLEVLLFMGRGPLQVKELAEFINCTPEEVQIALDELVQKYKSTEFGLQVINVSNGYQFATKPQFSKTLELYINAPQEITLSLAAMETLTIIAYRQPISRAEIEAIRGINSDWIVKSLMDKTLVEEKGRSETIGRPMLYGTSEMFLKHFGLKDLTELPPEPLQKMQNNKEAIVEKLEKFSHDVNEKLDLGKKTAEENIEPATTDEQEITVIEPYEVSQN